MGLYFDRVMKSKVMNGLYYGQYYIIHEVPFY